MGRELPPAHTRSCRQDSLSWGHSQSTEIGKEYSCWCFLSPAVGLLLLSGVRFVSLCWGRNPSLTHSEGRVHSQPLGCPGRCNPGVISVPGTFPVSWLDPVLHPQEFSVPGVHGGRLGLSPRFKSRQQSPVPWDLKRIDHFLPFDFHSIRGGFPA